MTPNQLAAFALTKELEAYKQLVSKEARHLYKRELVEMEQLRFMNMKYLAAALVLLDSAKTNEPTPDMFVGPVWNAVAERLALTAGSESAEATRKNKVQVLSYVVKVIRFRQEGVQSSTVLDEALIEQPLDQEPDPVAPGLPLPEEEEDEY
ncbi:Hypothetical protein POVN_LOCUS24 [uncultured virus]|nr:Hypothetical protein POVN_LOCUS24 [uncultured virus]